MRILHLINSLDRGGAEVLSVNLAKAQARAGHDVAIYVLAGGDKTLISEAEEAGVPVKLGGKGVYDLLAWWRLIRMLRAESFDVVHAHLFPAQYVAALAARLAKRHDTTCYITSEHSPSNRRRNSRIFAAADAWAYGPYRAIACVSGDVRSALVAAQPWIAGKCVVVENGVDFEEIARAKQQDLGHVSGLRRPIVLCVGRLEREKGQDVLVRAMKHLPGVSLALVGDGSQAESLRTLIGELDLGERVKLLGTRADAWGLMKDCDVYAQPSRYEGFGIAVLEALAAGAKVVCSDLASFRALVQHGGWLVRSEDDVSLAGGIDTALRKDWVRADVIVSRHFSIDAVAARYHTLYVGDPAAAPR